MRIHDAPPQRFELPARPRGSAAPQLRVGQSLQATVQQGPKGLFVEVAGQRLNLGGAAGVKAGDHVSLLVEHLQPRPSLRLQTGATDKAPQLLQQALRQLLAQPAARTPVSAPLNRMLAEAMPQGMATVRLPAPVQQALDSLLGRLPEPQKLQAPEGLRQALLDTGLFTEAKLANSPGRGDLGADLKAAALRLLGQLASASGAAGHPRAAPAPGGPNAALLERLGQQTEGFLSRLQQLQVHNAGAEAGRLDLAIELPLRAEQGLDLLQLRIREEQQGHQGDPEQDNSDEAPPPVLQVKIAFQFQDLGAVQATVRLQGDQVGAVWWAERPETATLFQAHGDQLQQRLEGLGLRVNRMALQAHRPPGPFDDLDQQARGLLSEKA